MPWNSVLKYLSSYTHVINYFLEDKKFKRKKTKKPTKNVLDKIKEFGTKEKF